MVSRTVQFSAAPRAPWRPLAIASWLALVAIPLLAAPALAQQPVTPSVVTGPQTDPRSRMLVQADELVYDYQKNVVSAVGNVQIYYEGGVLEATKVTYDRRNNKVIAEGNVRYRTKEGRIIHAELLEITDNFRDGFIKSVLVESTDKTRFAAARADRTEGRVTVYRSGIYTACELCKEDPKRPPLWQVKAARIIHDEGERVIHYEDARLEFFGIPVMWLPFFSHPDPTVTRKSGLLMPHFRSSSQTGYGIEIPYFWALAPNYDTTISITPYTRQGVLVKNEWRHRLVNGSYNIRTAGIFQLDKEAFHNTPPTPSPGYRTFRGSVETTGLFYINKQWNWGWDATLLTDRTFLLDYGVPGPKVAERTSQIFLVGQGDRSFFSLRGMTFTGLALADRNDEQPRIHPILDYSYILGRPVAGGELGYRVNFTSLSRQFADFDPTNVAAKNATICDSRSLLLNATPANCLLRGVPGDYSRLSAEMTWRRTIISSWGVLITPFATARTDAAYRRVTNDPSVGNFINTTPETLIRAMPAVGVETRLPLISVHPWGTQIVEPIAQIVARPNETQIGRFPNEDAQSLIFDDTNLFSTDKYTGYDRVEGGTRANVGVQYTATIRGVGTFNVLAGQSYHLFGRNSFAFADSTNVGLQSGLETKTSDYVARMSFVTTRGLTFTTRARFDKDDFAARRIEAEVSGGWGPVSVATSFGRFDAQPLLGYLERRYGFLQSASYKVTKNWTVSGAVRYDLTRQKIDLGVFTLRYLDECFDMMAQYTADLTNLSTPRPDHRFMLKVNLRTLSGG
jgi:LPS-assembly protein